MKTKYIGNPNKGYAYTFLSWFGITGLWVMYLQAKGLSLFEVGLCESIFHIASFLFEVPSGILADRLSYKLDLIIGRFAAIVSALLLLFGHSFWIFATAFVFQALSYNMQSGTLEALLYDSLKLGDKADKYPSVISNINVFIVLADTIGVVIAGFMVHWHFEFTYVIAVIVSVLGLGTVLIFKEPTLPRQKNSSPLTTKSIIVNSYQTLKENNTLRYLMIFDSVFAAVCTAYYYYFQSLMESEHFSGWVISVLMVLSATINIIGIKMTPRIQRQLTPKKLLINLTTALISLLLISWFNWVPLLLLLFLISQLLTSMTEPIFSNIYNEMIDSKQRATLLSVASVMFSAAMIFIFPLIGWLIEWQSFSTGFGIIGIGLLIITLFVSKNLAKL